MRRYKGDERDRDLAKEDVEGLGGDLQRGGEGKGEERRRHDNMLMDGFSRRPSALSVRSALLPRFAWKKNRVNDFALWGLGRATFCWSDSCLRTLGGPHFVGMILLLGPWAGHILLERFVS